MVIRTAKAWILLVIIHAENGLAAPPPTANWEIDGRVTVQIYDCGEQRNNLCGRIVGLTPHHPLPRPYVDDHNPDPTLRTRRLCGLTIITGLHPDGPSRWTDGSFYNPEDGHTYGLKAQLDGPDKLLARVYRVIPLFGESKIGYRLPLDKINGNC